MRRLHAVRGTTDGAADRGRQPVTVKIDGREIRIFRLSAGDRLSHLCGYLSRRLLKVSAPLFVRNIKIETRNALSTPKRSPLSAASPPQGLTLSVGYARLKDSAGDRSRELAEVTGDRVKLAMDGLAGSICGDIDHPVLYEMVIALETLHGADEMSSHFGFRTAGNSPPTASGSMASRSRSAVLNRHQSYPYVGYAWVGRRRKSGRRNPQAYAEVQPGGTSHYPQSTWFLDHCDRIGLLVLEEIPGWQHIGGEVWKQESIRIVGA